MEFLRRINNMGKVASCLHVTVTPETIAAVTLTRDMHHRLSDSQSLMSGIPVPGAWSHSV